MIQHSDRRRYLSNVAIALIVISALVLSSHYILQLFRKPSSKKRLSPSSLYSASHATDLAKLESDVILSSVAANLLPPDLDPRTPGTVPPQEAGKVIEDFKQVPASLRRWARVRRGVVIVGALAWFGVSLARAIVQKQWKGLAYPVSN